MSATEITMGRDGALATLEDGDVVSYAERTALQKRTLARRIGMRLARAAPAVVLLTTIITVWELIVRSRDVKVIYVPAPSVILDEVFGHLTYYYDHTLITLYEAAWGFAFGFGIAVLAAVLMAEFKVLDRALLPLFVMIKVTPSVAFLPVFIIMMGFGAGPKIIVAALTVFYAAMINSLTGFKDVDDDALEVLRSVDASRREIFFRLRLPNALPHLFAAAKICAPLAVLGAVFSEMQNSKEGLGNVILQSSHNIRMVRVWGAIFVLMFLGITIVTVVGGLERRLLRWHSSQRR